MLPAVLISGLTAESNSAEISSLHKPTQAKEQHQLYAKLLNNVCGFATCENWEKSAQYSNNCSMKKWR